MTTSVGPRVKLYPGMPPNGEHSMPTCGLCHVQIKIGERYAGVLYEPVVKPDDWGSGPTREVRHVEECADWKAGAGADVRDGDLIWSHRFSLTDWGPRIKAEVVHRTEDFNELGWRAVWLAPADPSSSAPLDALRAIGEEWAVKMADKIGTVDPLPKQVWMSDNELVHYKRPEENKA